MIPGLNYGSAFTTGKKGVISTRSHNISLTTSRTTVPSDVEAGDVILVLENHSGGVSAVTPAGYTLLYGDANGGYTASAFKISDGTEGGTSPALSGTSSLMTNLIVVLDGGWSSGSLIRSDSTRGSGAPGYRSLSLSLAVEQPMLVVTFFCGSGSFTVGSQSRWCSTTSQDSSTGGEDDAIGSLDGDRWEEAVIMYRFMDVGETDVNRYAYMGDAGSDNCAQVAHIGLVD